MGKRAGVKISVSLPRPHADVLDDYAGESHAGNRSAALAAILERAFPTALHGVTKSAERLPRETTACS